MDDNATLGKLDPELDALIEGLPTGEEDDKSEDTSEEDTTKDTEEEQVDEKEESEQSEESDEKTDDESEETEDSGESEDGYTIDGDEDADTVEEKIEDKPAGDLNPEQQYILDNIQPIVVQGTVGDSDKLQEFKVLSPEQLPVGFKFTDDRSREIASKNFSMLESQAQSLQNDFRSKQTVESAKAFREAEDTADRSDIGDMQRDGVIPKFKAAPDSPDFDKDPAVELVQKVLDFKEAENAKYLEAANQGKPYRHLGFEEAYYKYISKNPEKGRSEAQKKEDQEREKIARRTGKTNTSEANVKNSEPAPIFHNKREMENFLETMTW